MTLDLAKLRAPFPPERISWRVGSTNADKTRGMALAYIDARDVQDRLDEVVLPEYWQCRYPHASDKKTVCEIGIRFSDGTWVWKADGAGDTDFEAEKGALSDAFKRAAVRWGIGRYLYDVDAPWVAIKGAGKSFKIEDSELPKLRALLAGKAPPAEPKPAATGPDPKHAAAVAWAEDSIPIVRAFKDARAFGKWYAENSAKVPRIEGYDRELFNRLSHEVSKKLDAFNPIGVG